MLSATTFKATQENMFQAEIDGFIDCIQSGEKLPSHIDTDIIIPTEYLKTVGGADLSFG